MIAKINNVRELLRNTSINRLLFNYQDKCHSYMAATPPDSCALQHPYLLFKVAQYQRTCGDFNRDKLLASCHKILKMPLLSVAEKTIDSGELIKNDYLSFNPYFWNPEECNPLRSSQHQTILKDGRPNPFLTRLSDKPKLAQLCARVHLMVLADCIAPNSDYIEYAENQLHAWFVDAKTRMTPHMTFAQIMPWSENKIGIGLIDARWLILLIDALAIMDANNKLSPALKQQICEWLHQFALWILTSVNGRKEIAMKNNRGAWIDALLCYLALVMDNEQIVQCILKHALIKRPPEQFTNSLRQPLELRRYTFVSYSLYNLYPLFYLYHLQDWLVTNGKLQKPNGRHKMQCFSVPINELFNDINTREKGKIEFIDFHEEFSLNLYYPYCFSQFTHFPCINPFPGPG